MVKPMGVDAEAEMRLTIKSNEVILFEFGVLTEVVLEQIFWRVRILERESEDEYKR